MLIIIAIGLVVLVISILMYTNFVKKSDKTLNQCGLGGVGGCVASDEVCTQAGGTVLGKCPATPTCCSLSQAEIDERTAAKTS